MRLPLSPRSPASSQPLVGFCKGAAQKVAPSPLHQTEAPKIEERLEAEASKIEEEPAVCEDEPFPMVEPLEWLGGRGFTEGPLTRCGPPSWGMHEYAEQWSSDEDEDADEGDGSEERCRWISSVLSRFGVRPETPPPRVRVSLAAVLGASSVRLSIAVCERTPSIDASAVDASAADTDAADIAGPDARADAAEVVRSGCVRRMHPSWHATLAAAEEDEAHAEVAEEEAAEAAEEAAAEEEAELHAAAREAAHVSAMRELRWAMAASERAEVKAAAARAELEACDEELEEAQVPNLT
jgi:hypothetical protein